MKPLVLSFSTSRYGEPSTFGEYIRKARFEKGLRQKDVARAIGVDEMTIVSWEKREAMPRRKRQKIEELSKVLGTRIR